MPPKIKKRSTEFDTPWFSVIAKTVEGMPGNTGDAPYYAIKPEDYVSILAINNNKKVILVRQYRPAIEDYSLELPSGHVKTNEKPEVAAKRELTEETGYLAQNVELLGCLTPDTGRLLNKLWCYFAKDVILEGSTTKHEEGIDLVLCSVQDLKKYIAESEFNHALNLALVSLAIVKGLI